MVVTITMGKDGFNHKLCDGVNEYGFMGSRLKPKHMRNWYKSKTGLKRVHMEVV